MKILFLVPPNITYDKFVNPPLHNVRVDKKLDGKIYGHIITEISLGCLSMSAYIKKHMPDIDIQLIDFGVKLNKLDTFKYSSFQEFFKQTLSQVDKPDIVCITTLFMVAYNASIELAKSCKELFGDSLIILGGGVPTNLYTKMFKDCQSIDAICFGEGELPLLSLIKNRNFHHPSWITKETVSIPKLNLITNLDDIPLYDFDLINLQDYTNTVASLNPAVDSKKTIQYMTSRGCRYNCTFCSSHSIHGNKIRHHSLSRIKRDLRYFKSIGVTTIVFQDDNMLFDKDRFKEILIFLKELNIQPFFQNGLNICLLDKEILTLLKNIGTKEIVLPIESGKDSTLRHIMHKPLNCEMIKKVVNLCQQLDIYTSANILIGLPGETKQDIIDSIAFLKTLNINWYHIFNFSPLVGSFLYQVCVEKGYIDVNVNYIDDYKTPIVNTEEFTSIDIEKLMYQMNIELNFIYNSDLRQGRYQKALLGFKNVISARYNHALAHYYLSYCYQALNQTTQATQHMALCLQYQDDFWKTIFQKYGINI